MRIYLSGPITGSKPQKIHLWRREVARKTKSFAQVIDPTLHVIDSSIAYLEDESPKNGLRRLKAGRLVVERNRRLIEGCDILIANFLGSKGRVSIGSVCEISWAFAYGKFVVVVRDEKSNIHDHAMLNAMASSVCNSVEEALRTVEAFAVKDQRVVERA